ncbi:hypothetical protein Tco_1274561 [Tanacetum coccineum]
MEILPMSSSNNTGVEEQAKNFRWGLHKSILDHVMCIQFTDVAQVADAARNLEILRDRDDYDRSERSDKRHKSGDRYHPYSQQGSHRSHGQSDDRQKNDRQGSDRQGGGGNYRNNNNNNYSRDNNRSNLNRYRLYLLYDMNLTSRHGNRNSGAGRDQRNRGQQSHRSTNSGSQQSRVPSEGYTHPVCNTCGRRHPGECPQQSVVPSLKGYNHHRVAYTRGRRHPGEECRPCCWYLLSNCGQVVYLQRGHCKKNIWCVMFGRSCTDKKPDALGVSLHLLRIRQPILQGTITGDYLFGRAVFVLFDKGAEHSVISTKFAHV